MNPFIRLIVLASALFFVARPSLAGELTLAWDAPNDPTGITGYLLCYGPESGHYTAEIDVGNVITTTLRGLPPGEYYFAVKAYGTEGKQSSYSNEISETIELPLVTLETLDMESRLIWILCNWGDVPAVIELEIGGTISRVVLGAGSFLRLDSPPENISIDALP
jgi:hypothetical protein